MSACRHRAAIAALLSLSLFVAAGAAAQPAGGAGAQSGSPAPAPGDIKLAERLNRQGRHEEALTNVEAFLGVQPDDAAGRFLRGVILSDLGRDAEAIEVFTLLTADHPELPQPFNNLGVLYAQAGQLQRARQSLELAVDANPKDAVALENLGDVYVRLATDTYERATLVDVANRVIRSKLTLARNLVTAGRTPGPESTR